MTTAECFVGIDVSKETLDIHIRPEGTALRLPNTPEGHRQLVALLAEAGVTRIALEATGGYEGRLIDALLAAGLPASVVNPFRVRKFAEAGANQAKTDSIDAAVLAHYAQTYDLEVRARPEPAVAALEALDARRRQLVEMRQAERNRLATEPSAAVRASLEAHIAWLDGQIRAVEAEAAELIKNDPAMKEKDELMRTAPGVGVATSRALLGYLPELGRLTGKQIASLAGLAPFARDSGKTQGKREIRGGRSDVRRALYMAALSAIRTRGELREFYEELRGIKQGKPEGRGKPAKVALTAVARKLLVRLNAMVRDNRPWMPNQAAQTD